MQNAQQALDKLIEGNRRFVAGLQSTALDAQESRRYELVMHGQQPFAIVIGCSDARVPAEIVFDQGLGDLFVIRVAGNIIAPSQVASVEFAAEKRPPTVQVRPSSSIVEPIGNSSTPSPSLVAAIRPTITSPGSGG